MCIWAVGIRRDSSSRQCKTPLWPYSEWARSLLGLLGSNLFSCLLWFSRLRLVNIYLRYWFGNWYMWCNFSFLCFQQYFLQYILTSFVFVSFFSRYLLLLLLLLAVVLVLVLLWEKLCEDHYSLHCKHCIYLLIILQTWWSIRTLFNALWSNVPCVNKIVYIWLEISFLLWLCRGKS